LPIPVHLSLKTGIFHVKLKIMEKGEENCKEGNFILCIIITIACTGYLKKDASYMN
jgi:hypothetical protein